MPMLYKGLFHKNITLSSHCQGHWPNYKAKNDKDKSYCHDILDKEVMYMTADRIKTLREARGWTQAELARRLNMTRNGVNSWEQGLSMPSPPLLVELAKLFSVSTDYLLGLEPILTIDVSDLDDEDIALLTEIADRLRKR